MSCFCLVTLGCFRNEVESDNLRSFLHGMGHTEVESPLDADFIIVNSCGFISEACDEGIDTILKLSEILDSKYKSTPVVVAGCMAQRYGIALMNEMPEISAIVGVDWAKDINKVISSVLEGEKYYVEPGVPKFADVTRHIDSSETASLFVRISDGCDRRCNFCTIPSIRGKYVSRKAEDIIEEIIKLNGDRKREVVLVGQDLTCYGKDLDEKIDLAGLLRRISDIRNVHWIRLLYLQPEGLSDELIEEIVSNPRVCNYFDIPFQHASEKIIKRMGRRGNADYYKKLIESIRKKEPGSVIRTTLMVGFPGEGEEEFDELCGFVEEVKFDWMGAFRYSAEEKTRAGRLNEQVPHEVALKRYNRILEIQDSIEDSKSDNFRGKELEVVVEEMCSGGEYGYIGRSYREAPVVDGIIYLTTAPSIRVETGDFVVVRITGREGLDLAGEILRKEF